MKTVITYGTFDILHEGHIRLLERAKTLGDRLIVGITSDSYDQYRGKLNVVDPLAVRIEKVKATGLADEIIVEEYEGQKLDDITARQIDIFTIGSDWAGQFDYLKEVCEVVYLERTRGISSTELRRDATGLLHWAVVLGDAPTQHADIFVRESKYVSGITADIVWSPDTQAAQPFCDKHELNGVASSPDAILADTTINAVYIAQDNGDFAGRALAAGKHVLAEPCFGRSAAEKNALLACAAANNVVFCENLVTLHCPGFARLVSLAKSGRFGEIQYVTGCVLSDAPSVAATALDRLLGEPCALTQKNGFAVLESPRAHITIGLHGTEDLRIAGTKGYIHVPAPWWKTEYFEMHTGGETRKFYYAFMGEGVRYTLVHLMKQIARRNGGTS